MKRRPTAFGYLLARDKRLTGVGVVSCPYDVIDQHPTRFGPYAVTNGVLYGTDGSSIVKSDDQGATWATLHTFAGTKVVGFLRMTSAGTFLAAIRNHPGDEANASNDEGELFRSTDNGATWTKVLDFLSGSPRYTGFDSLGDTVLIAEYGGRTLPNNASRIYRSTDDGATWGTPFQLDTGSALHVHFVRFDPYVTDVVYAGTGDTIGSSLLWRSTDGGATFAAVFTAESDRRYRLTDAEFSEDSVYLGGDQYIGNGERFGFYRLRKSDDQWSKMADVQGPVYRMRKDEQGRIWAVVQASPNVPVTPDPGGADYASIFVLRNGAWREVVRLAGLGFSGGFWDLEMDGGYAYIRTNVLAVVPQRGVIRIDQDAPFSTGGVLRSA